MKNQKSVQLFEASEIQSRIVAVRNVQVMLDRDLAVLYGVQTKVLNQAVKRNIERFPDRFMFRLVESEMRELVTNCDRFETLKHSGVPMYAFTEQGVAMLSAVLRSKIAKFNRQYKGLAVTYSDDFHDRFLIIDNVELHGLGSSINCRGRRVAYYTTRDAK
ncbi:MAG: ORF6N domain-containing protein [Kiritimatiellae bacterium]|nr:ORF6N domain-containing protein [Kiritimatiellia bacterium]